LGRLLATCIVIIAIFVATWTETGASGVAASGSRAVLETDQTFRLALKNKDSKTAGSLLDQEFTWTNEAGQARKRAKFLQDSAAGPADSGTEYSSLKAREYGQLAIVTGMGARYGHADVFFARIWVKRQAGWLLLTHQSTAVIASGAPSHQEAVAAGDGAMDDPNCENPCHTVPYMPKTAAEDEVVKAYQAVETAVIAHDSPTWAYHVADEFVGIGRRYTGKPDAKAERVSQIAGSTAHVTLPKMLSLQIYVFGGSAIMIADHQPGGELPYHVIRLWVNRDGRWQLLHRQETAIEQTAGASR
jgi:hypothetical protein